MKKLIGNSEILEIIIDSESFDNLLNEGNEDVQRILKYSKSEFLRFIRSPLDTEFKELQIIFEFNKKYDTNGNLHSINLITDSENSTAAFDYESDYISMIGKKLYNKDRLNQKEIETINLFFIHTSLGFNENTNILITCNDFLLKNRLELYSYTHLHKDTENRLSILTINEAKELMKLFLRYHKEFILDANPLKKFRIKSNRGFWYWYYFRSKIPYFHVGYPNEPFLDAFSTRFIYLLRSVDEIGFQYYMGVNNDTMDDIMYHFNYSISLITGIFDSLALIAKNKYNLRFRGDDIPQRTSLNPKAGKNFLKSLKQENVDLRQHIQNYVNLIKLIYALREMIIHRKMLEKTRFSHGKWKMNAIKINNPILYYFSNYDQLQKFKPITDWGVYKINEEDIFLEPFSFIKMILKNIFDFSNNYFKLLGFTDFIKELKDQNPNDHFVLRIESFIKGNLE